MALNKNNLKNAILAALRQAKDEGWNEVQVADAWAKAIDDYVRGAVVKNVEIDIDDGKQIGSVPLE